MKNLLPIKGQGNSMIPLILSGAIVLVNQQSHHCKKGDIVLIKNPSGSYIHRITDTDFRKKRVKTRGDFSQVSDGWIPLSHVVGTAETVMCHTQTILLSKLSVRLLGNCMGWIALAMLPHRPTRKWYRRIALHPLTHRLFHIVTAI